jgi:acyl carrier protein
MTDKPKAEQLAELLSDILNEEVSSTRMDAKIVDDYGADSMDMVDIADRVEEMFDVEVKTDDIKKIQTFGDTLALIEANKRNAS